MRDPHVAVPPAGRQADLTLRIVSSLVMAPLALAVAWFGGWPFALFWTVAAALVLLEWTRLVRTTGDPGRRALWMAAGLVYAAAMLMATLSLRADPVWGVAAIVFVFAVVWPTDIIAYFTGRAFGGPKLMPRVSPKKTWSGAIGGSLAGMAGGLGVGALFGAPALGALVAVALGLSVVSQAGDLMESALKRLFDAKDSGSLIPGHGGLMDRLDGYAVAVVAAALVGIARGGVENSGRGLMVW